MTFFGCNGVALMHKWIQEDFAYIMRKRELGISDSEEERRIRRELQLPEFNGRGCEDWILEMEDIFHFFQLNEEAKMMAAILALEGEALQWFEWEHQRRPFYQWGELKEQVVRCFPMVTATSWHVQPDLMLMWRSNALVEQHSFMTSFSTFWEVPKMEEGDCNRHITAGYCDSGLVEQAEIGGGRHNGEGNVRGRMGRGGREDVRAVGSNDDSACGSGCGIGVGVSVGIEESSGSQLICLEECGRSYVASGLESKLALEKKLEEGSKGIMGIVCPRQMEATTALGASSWDQGRASGNSNEDSVMGLTDIKMDGVGSLSELIEIRPNCSHQTPNGRYFEKVRAHTNKESYLGFLNQEKGDKNGPTQVIPKLNSYISIDGQSGLTNTGPNYSKQQIIDQPNSFLSHPTKPLIHNSPSQDSSPATHSPIPSARTEFSLKPHPPSNLTALNH